MLTRSILRCDWNGIVKTAFDEKGMTADDLMNLTPWAFASAFLKEPDDRPEVTVDEVNQIRAAKGLRPIIPSNVLPTLRK